jgi:hypothetical protein
VYLRAEERNGETSPRRHGVGRRSHLILVRSYRSVGDRRRQKLTKPPGLS